MLPGMNAAMLHGGGKDGTLFLAVGHATSPYITIYDWNTGSPVKISNPGTLPSSQGWSAAWAIR